MYDWFADDELQFGVKSSCLSFLERGQLLSKCNVHAVHAMRLENLSYWFRKGRLIDEMIIVIHGVYSISSEWPNGDNSCLMLAVTELKTMYDVTV